MVRTLSIYCVVCGTICTMSLAQQPQAGKSAADTENLSPYVRRMMSLDRNSDGRLSKNELPGDLAALLTKHDKDGDGNLTPPELSAIEREAMASRQSQQTNKQPRRSRRPGAGPRGRRQLNTSGDGSPVDPKQILRFALAFDKDKDGGLDAAELRQYATALAKRRERGLRQPVAGSAQDAPPKSAPLPKTKGLGADGVGDGGFGDKPQRSPR
ncbi:MAG TPA: hypothetical protein EYG03_01590 [Planctomycetes bacterium]|nr:hypothetical protein [Fuerstiella sp.]HIK90673.1 hypothetical protein [Planctomycetota bacterium]